MGCATLRNYGPEIDLTWQEGFQTDSRAEVEAYCRQTGTQWTWLDDQRLNTRQVRQAMVRHPLQRRDAAWFNHAHMFHVSNMPPALARALLDEVGEQGLPRNAYYGDGMARSRRRCWTPSAPPTARKPARSPGSAAMS